MLEVKEYGNVSALAELWSLYDPVETCQIWCISSIVSAFQIDACQNGHITLVSLIWL